MAQPHGLPHAAAPYGAVHGFAGDLESHLVPNFTGEMLIADAGEEIRKGFICKVYGVLATQLLLTIAIAGPLQAVPQIWVQGNAWVLAVSCFLAMATGAVGTFWQEHARRFPTNYLLLAAFTVFEGVIMGFAAQAYTWQRVLFSAGLTASVFLLLTVYVTVTKADFISYKPYVFGAFAAFGAWGLFLGIMALRGMHFEWVTVLFDLSFVMLVMFGVVFDTQLILNGTHDCQLCVDDFAFASFKLYIDIIQLFFHVLRLIGNRSGDLPK